MDELPSPGRCMLPTPNAWHLTAPAAVSSAVGTVAYTRTPPCSIPFPPGDPPLVALRVPTKATSLGADTNNAPRNAVHCTVVPQVACYTATGARGIEPVDAAAFLHSLQDFLNTASSAN